MTAFCHGKVVLKIRSDKEDVLEDARRRICESLRPKIRMAARVYYNANGDKEAQQANLMELSVQFLENGGTHNQLDALLNER